MHRTFSFYVVGTPKAQPRPRAFAIQRKGKAPLVRVYEAGTAENWKSEIAKAAKEAGVEKLEGPISMQLFFSFPRPMNHFKRDGRIKDNAPKFYVQRPDFDNLSKAVADALTTLGTWDDDSQLIDVSVKKNWALGCSQGGCAITISELT